MYHQLTFSEWAAVRRALGRGLRHVEIARELNLSVWTVDRIAAEMRYQLDPVPESELPVDDAPADYEPSRMKRCGGCGAIVYLWPCLACEMATMTQKVPPAPEVDDEPGKELPRPLTMKQRRWRRKRIAERVFGEGAGARW
jgi:hypothetical protein